MPEIMDDLALPMLEAITACLCVELADTPGGAPCFCGMVVGGAPVADQCGCKAGNGCGMAWGRVVRIFPSTSFPSQDSTTNGCAVPMAMTLELGVYRCLPVGKTTGSYTPPTQVEQSNAVISQMADWRAIMRALRCCEAIPSKGLSLGTYEVRTAGGCGGGVQAATIRLSRAPR